MDDRNISEQVRLSDDFYKIHSTVEETNADRIDCSICVNMIMKVNGTYVYIYRISEIKVPLVTN